MSGQSVRVCGALVAATVAVTAWVNADAAETSPGLTPIGLAQFFITPGAPQQVAWKPATATDTPLPYRISDYHGTLIRDGAITTDGDGTLRLPLMLERGYYEVAIGGEEFGIVAQPPYAGETDRFFGVDAVLTWLDRKRDHREAMVEMLARSGIRVARERFRWKALNPADGQWDWQESDYADDLRTIYAKHGIELLEMFHDRGPATGEPTVPTLFPHDLVQLSRSWPGIHDRWQEMWGALEVWNEPDGGYGKDLPADQYVPMVKAMRWSLQQHGVEAPMGGGVLVGADPGAYEQALVQNGMLDHVDFVSFHDYRRATDMQRIVTLYRAWMRESGKPHMPLWLSEVGFPWAKGPGRAPDDEDARSAMEITMKGVEARACGIARFMPFCLAFYEEGGVKSFSMIGREITPLRSMAAYVQSVRVLAHRPYVGDLRSAPSTLVRARVFGAAATSPSDALLAVLFTNTIEPVRVTLPLPVLSAEAVDGRSLQLDGGALTIAGGIAYVWLDPSLAARHVDTGTPAAELYAAGVASPTPPTEAGPIVLQHLIDADQLGYSPGRYLVSPQQAHDLRFRVRVTNLSAEPKALTLRLALPGESTTAADQTQTLTVAGQSAETLQWTVDAHSSLSPSQTQPIVITGADSNGRAISPLAIPLRVEGTLEQLAQQFARYERLSIEDVSRWQQNIAGHGTMQMSGADGGWQLAASFTKHGERWVYPQFRLDPAQLRDAQGLVLRLRGQAPAELRLMLFESGGGGYWTSAAIAPSDGQWHVAYVPFSDFGYLPSHPDFDNGRLDLDQVVMLAVGMHDRSQQQQNVLDVSELRIVADPRPRNTP